MKSRIFLIVLVIGLLLETVVAALIFSRLNIQPQQLLAVQGGIITGYLVISGIIQLFRLR